MTDRTLSGASGDPSPESDQGSFDGAPRGASPDNDNSSPEADGHAGPGDDFGAGVATESADGQAPAKRRRRRGGARRRRKPGSEAASDSGTSSGSEEPADRPEGEGDPDASASDPAEGAPGRKRRKRRRRRSSAGAATAEAPSPRDEDTGDTEADADVEAEDRDQAPEAADAGEGGEGGGATRGRRRKRRSRGGRGRKAPAAEAVEPPSEAEEGEGDEADVESAGRRQPARKKSRSRRRKTSERDEEAPVAVDGIPGEDDELDEAEVGEEGFEEPRRKVRSRGGRKRKGAAEPEADSAAEAPRKKRKAGPKNVILVNARDREETRVSVVQEGVIQDFQMTVKSHKSMVNDIYRGRVVNLEPAIGAAFIDFGQGRNGFLHTSDVLTAYGEDDWKLENLLTTQIDPEEWDEKSSQPDVSAELEEGEQPAEDGGEAPAEKKAAKGRGRGRKEPRGRGARSRARPRLPISDLLEKGDPVVVQVTKDAIGDKGPTLTTYISIPGRYLVLMPSMTRTGVSRKIEDEKERRRLKRILEGLDVPPGMGVIVRTAGVGCTKADIKRDLDYLLLLWESFGRRLTLGRGPVALYEESDVAIRTIRDLFTDDTEAVIVDDERVHKRVLEFVEKLMPENLDRIKLHDGPRPLFHTHGVEQDFERMFARRIDLPSGGSIVLDQTEALVAIDVNSGKTRSDGFDFEDIALKTNLDAVPEIARQIRLRDLGGIIVCDFIDMMKMSHRREVERALRDALAGDRARSKLGRISQFGLLEMTRQRLGPGLSKMLFQNCPSCRGSGRTRTIESRAEAILRRLGSALTLKGFTKVEVRAAPEVIDHLRATYAPGLKDLETRHARELAYTPVSDQVEDSVLRYLRADGREVRPGGRRKR